MADWQVKHPDQMGWPNLLAEKYDVTNVAQCGIGEYKILKQIQSQDLKKYNAVIISHTGPYRIHCAHHPIHHNTKLHKNADLIYEDLLPHKDTNQDAKIAVDFFERYFDLEYTETINNLICMEILNTLKQYPMLKQYHMVNFKTKAKYNFIPSYNVNALMKKHSGLMNHLNSQGNRIFYNIIDTWLQSLV